MRIQIPQHSSTDELRKRGSSQLARKGSRADLEIISADFYNLVE